MLLTDGLGSSPMLTSNDLDSILNLLPTHNSYMVNVAGGLLAQNFINNLQEQQLTGFVLCKFDSQSFAYVLFLNGRAVECFFCQNLRFTSGLAAYKQVKQLFGKALVSVYHADAHMVTKTAAASGTLQTIALLATTITGDVIKQLIEQERFSGILLHQKSPSQAWLIEQGQIVAGGPLPVGNFSAGRIFSIKSPTIAPADLFSTAETASNSPDAWNALSEVLKRHLGRSAEKAFERINKQNFHLQGDALVQKLSIWIDDTIGSDALEEFKSLIKQ